MSLLQPKTFLTRRDAAALLREAGVPVRDSTLESTASNGQGPKYSIVNGRALYVRADLEAWLEQRVRGEQSAA